MPLSRHKPTWVERLAKLKDVFVQLDVLHAGGTPLVLQRLELLHELGTAVLCAVHVAQQSFPVSFQLSHLHSQQLTIASLTETFGYTFVSVTLLLFLVPNNTTVSRLHEYGHNVTTSLLLPTAIAVTVASNSNNALHLQDV